MSLRCKKTDLEKVTLYAFGYLGTMPLLMIRGNTLFTYLAMILVLRAVIELIIKKKMNVNIPVTKYYVLIACISVISAVHCLCSDIPVWWKDVQIKELIWVFIYLFLLIYYSTKENHHKVVYFVRGIYAAAIFQMIWGYMQFIFIKGFHIDLNRLVFWDILRITQETSHYKGEELQLSGLCWHVANMAPLVILGYAFSSNVVLKTLFMGFSVISGSRTLLLGCAVCCFLDISSILLNSRAKIKYNTIVFFMGIGLSGILLLLFRTDILATILTKIKGILHSFTILTSEPSAIVHTRYLTSIPFITRENDLLTNLFGFGLHSSGYSQVKYWGLYGDAKTAWVLECDYANDLWNTGYIAFVVKYLWMMKEYVKSIRIDRKYFIFLSGILIEGITYNVQFNWCWILILFIFVLINYNIKTEQIVTQ